MIGKSAAFRRAVTEATQVAKSDAGVLLSGESGTGKELLAAHIHRESPLASRAFVKVNCAAIPTELIESELFGHEKGAFTGAAGLRRGKFELADGGTIFLDEVGDLHEASQAKLLRVLQDGEVQRLGGEQPIRVAVRVISATNRQLDLLIAENKFRQDLFYRLSVVPIRVPALRERREDIADLDARTSWPTSARATTSSRRRWMTRSWRCSRTTTGRATCASSETPRSEWRFSRPGDRITVDSVPFEIRAPRIGAPSDLHQARDDAERQRILRALDETDWNVSGAARLLGIERTSLHKRMKTLKIGRTGRERRG